LHLKKEIRHETHHSHRSLHRSYPHHGRESYRAGLCSPGNHSIQLHTVNGKQLPAGNYTLGTDVTSPQILKISDWTQHASALAMAMPAAEQKHKSNQLVPQVWRSVLPL